MIYPPTPLKCATGSSLPYIHFPIPAHQPRPQPCQLSRKDSSLGASIVVRRKCPFCEISPSAFPSTPSLGQLALSSSINTRISSLKANRSILSITQTPGKPTSFIFCRLRTFLFTCDYCIKVARARRNRTTGGLRQGHRAGHSQPQGGRLHTQLRKSHRYVRGPPPIWDISG